MTECNGMWKQLKLSKKRHEDKAYSEVTQKSSFATYNKILEEPKMISDLFDIDDLDHARK